MGYLLKNMQRDFLILEQATTITPAWRSRCDSFSLLLLNWTLQLPDDACDGPDPDGFLA